MTEKPVLLVLAGPTASGKTNAAIQAALRLDAEILSADSMQVYRGMDIGTAKATPQEQALVPHHLIDICDMAQSFTVSQYRDAATRAIDDIVSRGKLPLLVGGTGLYIRAIADGLDFAGQMGDSVLRQRLTRYARIFGGEALHKRLANADPASAEKLHPNDTRRIIRALEIHMLTGAPISSRAGAIPSPYDVRYAALHMDREHLVQRIALRVEQMLKNGLVDEARRVMQYGGATAKQALGYKQLFPYLAGECTLQQAEEAIIIGTRQYAKRQMTWFRGEKRAVWFDAEDPNLIEHLTSFYTTNKI